MVTPPQDLGLTPAQDLTGPRADPQDAAVRVQFDGPGAQRTEQAPVPAQPWEHLGNDLAGPRRVVTEDPPGEVRAPLRLEARPRL